MKTWVKAIYVCLIFIVLIFVLIIYWQRKFIYCNGPTLRPEFRSFKKKYATPDGTYMDVIEINKNSDVDIIYYSGNYVFEADILDLSFKFSELAKANVFSPLYSGVNNTYKSPTQKNLTNDLEYLAEILNKRKTKKIIFGFSIGTAQAIRMALKAKNVRSLILMNSMTNLRDVVAEFLNVPLIKYLIFDEWDNLNMIDKINVPIYYLISERDTLVKPSNSIELISKTKKAHKVIVSRANHNDIWMPYNFYVYVITTLLEAIKL